MEKAQFPQEVPISTETSHGVDVVWTEQTATHPYQQITVSLEWGTSAQH